LKPLGVKHETTQVDGICGIVALVAALSLWAPFRRDPSGRPIEKFKDEFRFVAIGCGQQWEVISTIRQCPRRDASVENGIRICSVLLDKSCLIRWGRR
jgi:hypothetical protein